MIKKQYYKSKSTCKITFSLPKEAVNGGKEVKVLGEFNDWQWENGITMKAAKKEYQAVLELEAGRNYEFRYLIDNNVWENDWAADDYVPTPFGVENSVVFIEDITVATKSKTTKTKATKTKKDKLTKIEGIGPKIEKLLNAAGIITFADLAKAQQETLKAVLVEAGPRFKMHTPDTWPTQAQLAADGEWEKLEKLQDELDGGKKKKK